MSRRAGGREVIGVTAAMACAAVAVFAPAGRQLASAGAAADTTVRRQAGQLAPRPAATALELVIGAPAPGGIEDHRLRGVPDATIGADGSLYVVDDRRVVVRVFAADGKPRGTIGRRGQGPGAYTLPRSVRALRDGRVAVYDAGDHSLELFTAAGAPAASWDVPVPAGSIGLVGAALHVDSWGVSWVYWEADDSSHLGTGRLPARRKGWVRLDDVGKVIDTVGVPALPPEPVVAVGGTTMMVPYAPSPHFDVGRSGCLVTGFPDRYAFELLCAPVQRVAREGIARRWRAGDPVISIRRSVPLIRLMPGEVEANQAYVRRFLARAPTGAHVLHGPDVPSQKPAYRGLDVALDGRIWLAVHSPSAATGIVNARDPRAAFTETLAYDVFEPHGAFTGRVELPADGDVLFGATTGDRMWMRIATDDDRVELRRYRIRWRVK